MIVAAVVDEEWLSAGAEALVGSVVAEAAIVLEATDLDIVVEHGGFAWFELESTGFEAAGDDTDHGRDAIANLGAVLSEIRRSTASSRRGPAPPLGPRERARVDDHRRRAAVGLARDAAASASSAA